MVEERPWPEVDQDWKTFQAKLNFYIGACKDPAFPNQIPAARGRQLGVRFACRELPDPAGMHALSLMRGGCEHFGFKFQAVLLREGPEPTMEEFDVSAAQVEPAPRPAKRPWWRKSGDA